MSALILLLLSAATGCGIGANWFHPGTVQQQRYRATLFDPYSATDLGPTVDGGRPRDFQRPAPEAVRNRYFNNNLSTPRGR